MAFFIESIPIIIVTMVVVGWLTILLAQKYFERKKISTKLLFWVFFFFFLVTACSLSTHLNQYGYITVSSLLNIFFIKFLYVGFATVVLLLTIFKYEIFNKSLVLQKRPIFIQLCLYFLFVILVYIDAYNNWAIGDYITYFLSVLLVFIVLLPSISYLKASIRMYKQIKDTDPAYSRATFFLILSVFWLIIVFFTALLEEILLTAFDFKNVYVTEIMWISIMMSVVFSYLGYIFPNWVRTKNDTTQQAMEERHN